MSEPEPAALISCRFLDRMAALMLFLNPFGILLMVASGGLEDLLPQLGRFWGSVLAISFMLLLGLTAVVGFVSLLLFWFGVAIKLLWARSWIWLLFVVLTNLMGALIAHLALRDCEWYQTDSFPP